MTKRRLEGRKVPRADSRRHVPQRTCVGCRRTEAKRSLIRIVRTSDGVRVDPTGKVAGRGAYLHDQRSCWKAGLSGPLAKALRTELTTQDQARLMEALEAISSDKHVQ